MRTIKLNSKSHEVYLLGELLLQLGYQITVSNSFNQAIDMAVKHFQSKHHLVVDGIVGLKTWSKLIEINPLIFNHTGKLLSEYDLLEFAVQHNVELASIKAVNEVESAGLGFLISGKPKILFEGHVFWRELLARGLDPSSMQKEDNKDILFSKYTKTHYKGGEAEYSRMERAAILSPDPQVREAALSAASWGLFQIMGYHAVSLGYNSVNDFVSKMYINEDEHLKAVGRFLKLNNLLDLLRQKNWAEFARRYNGAGYKTNRYDEKLQKAYLKYATT